MASISYLICVSLIWMITSIGGAVCPAKEPATLTRRIEYPYSSKRRKYTSIVSFCLLLLTVIFSASGYATEKNEMTLRLGGCGGGLFLRHSR